MRKFTPVAILSILMVFIMSIGIGSAQDMKVLNTAIGMVGGDLNTIDPG